MAEYIHRFTVPVWSLLTGATYEARAIGESRRDGTWAGWLEFRPASGYGPALRTHRETTQPDREALVYWAGGLEPIDLESALSRAHPSY